MAMNNMSCFKLNGLCRCTRAEHSCAHEFEALVETIAGAGGDGNMDVVLQVQFALNN